MKATVTFRKCLTDSQELGGDAEYMVSRVFFDLTVGTNTFVGLYADVKQTVGSDFETADLEVGAPHGYKGVFNHVAFRAAAERYYRSCVGSTGRGFHIVGGKHNRIQDCVTELKVVEAFEVGGSAGGW